MDLAFLGLGVMGYPMAGHLQKAGNKVVVFNRTTVKAEKWIQQYGGASAPTPAEAVKDAQIVFACVGNDDDLRSICTGVEGVFSNMKPGAAFVDHTTASATIAREMSESAKKVSVDFIDAPVSGGQVGAETGKLTIMVGGDKDVFETIRPVLMTYAKACEWMGPSGAGQLAKMVNQICIAGIVQGLAEGLNFAIKSGLDIETLLSVISKGAAQSWQMENRGHTMVQKKFDFGFAVDWMRKDLGICLSETKNNGARLPLTALVDQFYAQVQERGGRRWDTSSLIHLLLEP